MTPRLQRAALVRIGLAVLGLAMATYGGYLLLSRQDLDRVLDAGIWLAAGVVLHDFVLSLLLIGLGAIGMRLLPAPSRAPATVALLLLGSLSIVAVPVLGRFGARDDNPTLLDRPYLSAWWVLVILAIAAVLVASLIRARRDRGADPDVGESEPVEPE